MAEVSEGKDTTTGHWELMGLITRRPFPVYPQGFPPDLIARFEQAIGRRVLGNKVASGTEIIAELGEEHIKTGCPIVYTSADSVFQIAAHEEVIPLAELYQICQVARDMLKGEHGVARVIARPFLGATGSFVRTENRHDYSLEPPEITVLDVLVKNGYETTGIGKIKDIFAGRGITHHIPSGNNNEGIRKIIETIDSDRRGLVFANLVDFDTKYGHRNDPEGYGRALEEVDRAIPGMIDRLRDSDVLIFTADHGCDPTTPSTDHSREYVPLLVVGKEVRVGTNLGIRESFADLGKTVIDLLGAPGDELPGQSFTSLLLNQPRN
jgi:phosphopentomutase